MEQRIDRQGAHAASPNAALPSAAPPLAPTDNRIPKHIGIILDGNRRFAKRLMLKPWKGHEWGAKKFEDLLRWCEELGIREVTAYAFSVQNFNRPKEEFDFLMDIFRKECAHYLQDGSDVEKNQVRVNFIGRIWMFPQDIQESMRKVMDKTRKHDKHIINMAMAYGGREEVLDAVQKIARQVKAGTLDIAQINEQTFSRNLYMDDEPELIIRTGGEQRTSNFLIWQSWYSEWFFLEKPWPEFEKEDLVKVIREYQSRDRRFGK